MKSLAQIAYEAWSADLYCPTWWEDLSAAGQQRWARIAEAVQSAVISEQEAYAAEKAERDREADAV